MFDSSEPVATTDPSGDGTLTVEFVDCANELVRYGIASLGKSREIPIQRVARDNMALCEMPGGQ
jgi:hypothetical protein